jgi:hypothetical protein
VKEAEPVPGEKKKTIKKWKFEKHIFFWRREVWKDGWNEETALPASTTTLPGLI